MAAVKALAELAKEPVPEQVNIAYGETRLNFGSDYIIPKPFDPRLIAKVPPAVAKAAMDTGVAKRPIEDFDAYRLQLERFVYKSGMTMKPVFEKARANPKRVIFAEGEDRRVGELEHEHAALRELGDARRRRGPGQLRVHRVGQDGRRLGHGVARERLGRKRVIQVRFNVSVPRARVPEKSSTLRGRSKR